MDDKKNTKILEMDTGKSGCYVYRRCVETTTTTRRARV
jgi:hypothetical protein